MSSLFVNYFTVNDYADLSLLNCLRSRNHFLN